jgi:hypothetical protein
MDEGAHEHGAEQVLGGQAQHLPRDGAGERGPDEPELVDEGRVENGGARRRAGSDAHPADRLDDEGQRHDDEEDARGVDEGDGARVATLVLADGHHLDEAAGHPCEIGGHGVEARHAAEIEDAEQPAHQDEENQAEHRGSPAGDTADHGGREAGPEHDADHHGHGRAHHGGSGDGRLEQSSRRAGRHRAQHPGQRQPQRREQPAARGSDEERGEEAQIGKPPGREITQTRTQIVEESAHAERS